MIVVGRLTTLLLIAFAFLLIKASRHRTPCTLCGSTNLGTNRSTRNERAQSSSARVTIVRLRASLTVGDEQCFIHALTHAMSRRDDAQSIERGVIEPKDRVQTNTQFRFRARLVRVLTARTAAAREVPFDVRGHDRAAATQTNSSVGRHRQGTEPLGVGAVGFVGRYSVSHACIHHRRDCVRGNNGC